MVDLARHSRHILLPQVGVEGQTRLAKAKVLCVGAGGLGCPVIQYLAAAGVGHITIVDDDMIDISNLQRQILHRTADVGTPKAESAARFVAELDPNISVAHFVERVSETNAKQLFEGHDIIIDGTDNIPTRYLIDNTCIELGIPWVYGSVYRFEGQVSVFNLNGGPTYSDLFPEAPPAELIPSCAEAGVLGVLPGTIGCLQATEVIKIIIKQGEPLRGKLLIFDALETSIRTLKFGNVESEQVEESTIDADETMMQSLDASEAIQRIEGGWNPYIIDVRRREEREQNKLARSDDFCPHEEIVSVIPRIPDDRDVLLHCLGGIRSSIAIAHLIQSGFDSTRLFNLEGGIAGWSAVDPDGIIHG